MSAGARRAGTLRAYAIGYLFFLSQAAAQAFAATFKDFPPIQKPNTFTIDDAISKLAEATTSS